MPYATAEDMIARFGEVEMIRLSAAEGQLDQQVDLARVALAIQDADALIDGYLRVRYATPLGAPVPAEIRDCSCNLARWHLARGEQKTPSEEMRRERVDLMRWLASIARGEVLLQGAGVFPATSPAASAARTTDRAREFAAGGGLP